MQEVVEVDYLEIEEDNSKEKLINEVVKTCFVEESLQDMNLYISITLTNSKEIRRINKEYRKIDKETDVLSFPMFEKEEIDERVSNKEKGALLEVLGDIIISIEKVEEQAKEYGHSFERELSYMIVHGFYHIMGYDHMTEEEKDIMREKEEIILTRINQTR